MFKKRILKTVILPSEIEASTWGFSNHDNKINCDDCNSNLFYANITWGVVEEESTWQIMGNRSKRTYALREIGLCLYCAECGCFEEDYAKWFYPKDKTVCTWDELDGAEREEVNHCLNQWDQKGTFTPLWKSSELNILKENLKEYEKKNPIKHKKKKAK